MVDDEFRCPKSGYYIDMLVHVHQGNAKGRTGAAAGWVGLDRGCGRVEFDGPSHFLTCRLPALLGMESTDGERQKDGVSKGAN